ncbi:MAG TPA: class I SAM-dependent methyltransferase [Pyrinomonadaceae bacterium]|nr:class I SAM-dependent methyltransferase [Pyrinomonadaceae bacterium]
MRGSDSTLSTQEIFKMLETAEQYLATISQQEAASETSQSDAVKIRVNLRNAAKNILNRSQEMDPQARQALKDFIAQQPEFLPGEYRFTVDSSSGNVKTWEKHLSRFAHQPDLEFLEIGSFEGGSACWLLKNILTDKSSRLTCIDTFDFAGQGSYYFQDEGSESMTIEDRFDFNIKQTGSAHKVRKLIGSSQEVLRGLPFSTYDFIYIDGSHKASNVLEDAVLSWPLLKKGGLLTFDDYEWNGDPDPLNCPGIAINAFLNIFETHYVIIHKSYQLTIEKI